MLNHFCGRKALTNGAQSSERVVLVIKRGAADNNGYVVGWRDFSFYAIFENRHIAAD